jgi:signal transduction histidine kinase
MHLKSWRELQSRVLPVWTWMRLRGAQVRSVRERMAAVWDGLTHVEQLAIVAVAALACGLVLSGGWPGGGAPGIALAITEPAIVALLIATVGRASEHIAVHRRAARDRDAEGALLIGQNADLRRQIEDGHRRAVESNERVLRRVGVELHDGPAQLISLALLRLDGLDPKRASHAEASLDDYERIRSALQDALAEIRCLAAGLTLPELSCVSPSDVLRLAVRNHERRTATSVRCEVDGLPQDVPAPIKSCLYRFAQEALNNAWRHAGGRGQTVRGQCRGNTIEVEVADAGPGFEPANAGASNRLGLSGMRERVASLGGTLEITSRPGAGTRLMTRFEVPECTASRGQAA